MSILKYIFTINIKQISGLLEDERVSVSVFIDNRKMGALYLHSYNIVVVFVVFYSVLAIEIHSLLSV